MHHQSPSETRQSKKIVPLILVSQYTTHYRRYATDADVCWRQAGLMNYDTFRHLSVISRLTTFTIHSNYYFQANYFKQLDHLYKLQQKLPINLCFLK